MIIAIGRGEFLGRAVHILARPLVDKIRRQKLEQRWVALYAGIE